MKGDVLSPKGRHRSISLYCLSIREPVVMETEGDLPECIFEIAVLGYEGNCSVKGFIGQGGEVFWDAVID